MSERQSGRKWKIACIGPMLTAAAVMLLNGIAMGQSNPKPNPDRWIAIDGTAIESFLPKQKPSVLLFLMTDCPIANKYAPELNRIIKDYRPKGVYFTAVLVDTGLSLDAAKRHAKDYGLDCTIALDPTHSLAKRAGATVSPEAVVVGTNGVIVYRGRIDDRVVEYGKIRPEPKIRDLRVTLDTLLRGKPVKVSRTRAVGCIFRMEPR
jgi:hypothetical protein